MKGIASCEDCEFDIVIYRFTGSQGLFSVPKNGVKNAIYSWQWSEKPLQIWALRIEGIIPSKQNLIKALTQNVVRVTEFNQN